MTKSVYEEEKIWSLLSSFNPWWNDREIALSDEYQKETETIYQRFGDGQKERKALIVFSPFEEKNQEIIKRMILKSLDDGWDAHALLYIPYNHPLLQSCSLTALINVYQRLRGLNGPFRLFVTDLDIDPKWDLQTRFLLDTETQLDFFAFVNLTPLENEEGKRTGFLRWESLELLPDVIMNYPKKITSPSYSFEEWFRKLLSFKESNDLLRKISQEIVPTSCQQFLRSLRMMTKNYPIRDSQSIYELLVLLSFNAGVPLNVQSLIETIKDIARGTIEKYLGYLASASCIKVLLPLKAKGYEKVLQRPLIYFPSESFRRYLSGEEFSLKNFLLSLLHKYFKNDGYEEGYLVTSKANYFYALKDLSGQYLFFSFASEGCDSNLIPSSYLVEISEKVETIDQIDDKHIVISPSLLVSYLLR